MSDASLILHVGAPKCGSSALQTHLTQHPNLRAGDGRKLRYTALRGWNDGYRLIQGRMVPRLGKSSPYGYACWPNFGRHTDSGPILASIETALKEGQKGGWVPILSCEGWINHPDIFAKALADMGHPRVDVVCYLRPPVQWVNAAWWQWGVWTVRNVNVWMERSFLPYGFADHLEKWAAIPGVKLHVRRSRPDAVGKFMSLYGCDLPDRVTANTSSPSSLIGFMLRNRRFHETPHSAQTEFIFQRWCPPVPGKRLWALTAQNVRQLRPVTRHSREVLQRILSPEDCTDLFADPRWHREKPYHKAILGGISTLHDAADLPALHVSLSAGIVAAAAAAHRPVPQVPADLGNDASLEDWDVVLAIMLDMLIEMDVQARRDLVLSMVRGVGDRLLRVRERLGR